MSERVCGSCDTSVVFMEYAGECGICGDVLIIVNKYNIIQIREDFHVVTNKINNETLQKPRTNHLFILAFVWSRVRLLC